MEPIPNRRVLPDGAALRPILFIGGIIMQFKDYKDGIRLSRLGMGNMRLPIQEDKEGHPIDYGKTKAIIDEAIRSGINYFDTAYVYHGGESEVVVGKALAEYPRESFYIADKFNYGANPDFRAQFEEQLKRLDMDYIDFYLLHAVGDDSFEPYTTCGCIEYFKEKKSEGKIRYLGFSFHGSPDTLRKLLLVHEWDFVQIQLNYYDWVFGTAKEQYEILTEAGIPVIVMEPVRGGMLAKLNEKTAAKLKDADPGRSIASWALRWVMGLDNVQVILSGMSAMDQMTDNVATFAEGKPLTAEERALAEQVAADYRTDVSVPCTACRYCTDDCPMGLEIPKLLSVYNKFKVDGPWALMPLGKFPEDKRPTACISCAACTGHCPQTIDVPKYMTEMAEAMKK